MDKKINAPDEFFQVIDDILYMCKSSLDIQEKVLEYKKNELTNQELKYLGNGMFIIHRHYLDFVKNTLTGILKSEIYSFDNEKTRILKKNLSIIEEILKGCDEDCGHDSCSYLR